MARTVKDFAVKAQGRFQAGKIALGAIAVATSFCVAQLAAGGDLAELRGSQGVMALSAAPTAGEATPVVATNSAATNSAATNSVGINREAKGDRAAARASMPAALPSHTISVRMSDQAESSFLVRVPTPSGDARRPPSPSLRTPPGKSMIACEPMVSVLTDIAKQLQPGRCVT